MKKNLLLAITVLASCLSGKAQTLSYDVASLPDSLKKKASVIKRYENTVFEVTSVDRASIKTHEVYTLMDGSSKGALNFAEYTTKFRFLDDVDIRIYDANGKQVNKYRKKDLYMRASGDGLIDERTYYGIAIPAPSFPVTVEYIYEIRYKGTLFYPRYTPGHGVLHSTFTAKVPKDLDLRYQERNLKLPPRITEDDKYKTYQWDGSNLPYKEPEEGTVSGTSVHPCIVLAPSRFKMFEYEGNMTSWKNLGMWYNDLHKGLDVLPEERQAFLKDLVKDAKTDREKVQLLYDYLQQNFRYVSIQLGIGGWRSLPANFTDQKKYGDCKGLTNYMQAALKAVGVKSYAALINSGYNEAPLDPSFPMNGFDHVILCVPQAKDSIWLECTSKTNDFDVLGTSTENRNALLCTEQGGVLVPTPASQSSDNRFDVNTLVSLQPDGSGKTVSTFRTTGEYKEIIRYILEEKKDDQKNFIINYMGFKQPDEFSLIQKNSRNMLTTDLEMSLEKLPEFIAGNKMFISPRLYKLSEYKLPKAENRKQDYYFGLPYLKTDTMALQLPEGFAVDALPQPKDIKCPRASYQTKYWYDEQKKTIYSTTCLKLDQHRIPAAEYAIVKKFFDEVSQDNAQRIVIRKL